MKVKRQAAIINFVNNYTIETQDDLAEKLLEAGYDVTQATISRDIRELQLSKVSTGDGKQKYVVLQDENYLLSKERGMAKKYTRVLKDCFVSMDMAQNIIVIKTVPGMAMAVAAAMDGLQIDGIVGSIAGDDTIMSAVRTLEDTQNVMSQIDKLVKF